MYKKLFWVYTVILILLSVLPINGSGSAINHTFIISIRLDYLLHFVVYLPWMFFLRKMTGLTFAKELKQVLTLMMIAILFAFANEAMQYFLPYRAFNINDLLANGFGVLLGMVVFLK